MTGGVGAAEISDGCLLIGPQLHTVAVGASMV